MFKLPVLVLFAFAFVAPIAALPPNTSAVRVVSSTIKVPSDLEKRQGSDTSIDIHCYCTNNKNKDRSTAVEAMAKSLENKAKQGKKCGVDKKKSHYTIASKTIDGQKYEVNLFFTGRVKQTTKAVYSCKDLAKEVRSLHSRCSSSCKKDDRVLEWTWLINCISTPTFSSTPKKPYKEGGVGLELRLADIKASPPNY